MPDTTAILQYVTVLRTVRVFAPVVAVLFVFDVLTDGIAVRMAGRSMDVLLRGLPITAFAYLLLLALVPAFSLTAARWPLTRGRLLLHGALHVTVVVLSVVMHSAVYDVTLTVIQDAPWPTFGRRFLSSFAAALTLVTAVYAAILALQRALALQDESRRRALEEEQLRSTLARAELDALRTQIEPHFLFNTLHAISATMDEDVATARGMMILLSDLLRASMTQNQQQEVPLREEIRLVRSYLDLHRMRFGDRLDVTVDVPAELLDASVPRLSLQPIVENAVRHGLGASSQRLCVSLRAHNGNGRLHLVVENDGIDFTEAPGTARGIGLSNTAARLERLYGPHQSLHIGPRDHGGTLVTITLPRK